MSELAKDLDRFSHTWLANPAAQLEFANLVDRIVKAMPPATIAVRAWVKEERDTAKWLGVQ